MRLLLILFLCTLITSSQAGETYTFSWKRNKDVVGELILTIESGEGGTVYRYHNVMNVNAGIEMNILEDWEALYSDDHILQEFTVESSINGQSRMSISESASERGLLRKVNGREKIVERPEIDYSYILLFMKPPAGMSEVYSELYGTMFKVTEFWNNTYTVTDSKNREHRFTYDDEGNLKRADVELSFGTFMLLPKE